MQKDRVKILYITGWGRSGSTIIENILGQVKGFTAVGEIRYIWDRGLIQNQVCGCSTPFHDCEMWRKIINEAFGDTTKIDAVQMDKLMTSQSRTLRILGLFLRGNENIKSLQTHEYLGFLKKLYASICHVTGSSIIVDSSKFPAYGALLSLIPEFDVYYLHVIRDPRAVAYSWSKPKLLPGTNRYMRTINPFESSLRWIYWNLVIESIGKRQPQKYKQFLYEDFILRPLDVMKEVLEMLEQGSQALPFINDHTVLLTSNHAISGNPGRFKLGDVAIVSDDRWITDMHPLSKWLVTIIVLPFLKYYGYPILKKK